MSAGELAAELELPLEGDAELIVCSAATVETAGPHDLAFAAGSKAASLAAACAGGCLILPPGVGSPAPATLRSSDPRASFAAGLRVLFPAPPVEPGVHPTACIAGGATLHPSCSIGPQVTVGRGTTVGAGTIIEAGCSIAAEVAIGAGCHLHPGVTVYSSVTIGDRVVVHSGAVLGADGFGFAFTNGRYEKFPQVGEVVIGDDVEIGANTCIDRAALGATSIGEGTKLDNMVHVGHNCSIGRHVVIAAQTGISGQVVIGDYAVIGGQVGIGDKAQIESKAIVGSGAGILTSKIVRAGQPVWGTPARPLKQYLEQLANVARLEELKREVKLLKARLSPHQTDYFNK
jgi:UDP-3-O-[3-hydroxymyristoyl] glucosamine N-acyltransferase